MLVAETRIPSLAKLALDPIARFRALQADGHSPDRSPERDTHARTRRWASRKSRSAVATCQAVVIAFVFGPNRASSALRGARPSAVRCDNHTIGLVDYSASASEHLCRHDAESRKLPGHGTEPSICTPHLIHPACPLMRRFQKPR